MNYLKTQERTKLLNRIEKIIAESNDQEKTIQIRIIPGSMSIDVKIGLVLKDGEVFAEESIIDWDNYDF